MHHTSKLFCVLQLSVNVLLSYFFRITQMLSQEGFCAGFSSYDTYRLFFLGITEENLAKLCEHAQIPSDYRFVDNVLFSHIIYSV